MKYFLVFLAGYLLLGRLGTDSAMAGDSFSSKNLKFWAEWDLNCYESSVKIRAEGKKGHLDSNYCATFKRRSSEDSTRETNFLMSDRHVDALIASAFYAKRKDVRERALDILKDYPCRTKFGCEQFRLKLESEVKVHEKSWQKKFPLLLTNAQKIVDRAAKDVGSFEAGNIEKTGICGQSKHAEKWLSEIFTMHCPLAKFGIEPAVNIVNEKSFASDLEIHSGQIMLSSSRILKTSHSGLGDCHKGWTTEIVCDGSVPQKNLAFDCKLVDSGRKSWGQELRMAECKLKP